MAEQTQAEKLREKIYLELLLAKAIEEGDYKLTGKILALIPDIEEARKQGYSVGVREGQYTNHKRHGKKMVQAREEAKKQERERIRKALSIEFKKANEEATAEPFPTIRLNQDHKTLWLGYSNALSEAIQYLNLLDRQALKGEK